jgi:hypothetical protein
MSYSARRRPSLLGRFGAIVSTVVSVALIYWFVFIGVRANRDQLALWLAEGVLSLVVAVVLHEGGHLVVGLATGEPVRKIRIGSGATLFGFRVRGLVVQVCLNPLGGGAVYFSSFDATPGWARLASLAAGPGANLIAIIGGFALYRAGLTAFGPFVLANVILFVTSAMPATTAEGGREHPSDGMQILNRLLKPAIPKTYYEGPEMKRDAFAVLVRAMEAAQISGAAEVTDEDLLRALNQDAAVGGLFVSVGLGHAIPPGRTPELDYSPQPKMSRLANEVLVQGIRKSRDLGVQKPNAAGICLGLLSVDCAASRLMREAGVTEEAVTRLASVATEDEDDLRRARVITADLPVERWGTAADKILAYAMRLAAADHSTFVGTQHLIAAMVADPQCRAARALSRLRFVLVWKKGAPEPGVEPLVEGLYAVISPQAALAIAGAMWRTGPTYPTGTAELCLGIVDQSAGIGAQILNSAGVTVQALERALPFTPRETSELAGCTGSSRGMWMFRAYARIGAERWLDARADFAECERTATTDEQRAVNCNNVAWVSLMAGDPAYRAEALEQARFAVAYKPDNPSFVGTLAFALLENGSPAEAVPMLESIIPKQVRPRSRSLDLCVLAMCQARLDQPDAAAASLQAALDGDPKCVLLSRARAELNKTAAPLSA